MVHGFQQTMFDFQVFHDLSIVFLWFSHDLSIFRWFSYEFSMVFLMESAGTELDQGHFFREKRLGLSKAMERMDVNRDDPPSNHGKP